MAAFCWQFRLRMRIDGLNKRNCLPNPGRDEENEDAHKVFLEEIIQNKEGLGKRLVERLTAQHAGNKIQRMAQV